MRWRRKLNVGWLLWGTLLLGGCEANPREPPTPGESAAIPVGKDFDAATAGSVRGQVLWSGPVPEVPPFEIRSLVSEWSPSHPRLIRENPHAPEIDPATGGVGGAVVFLRGVDPAKSRPWDHAGVVVEHQDRQLWVIQGGTRSRVGFIRRGDAVTMVSREKAFNALHAGGAAFFTLTFPDADQPLRRVLGKNGLVELSSASGAYWMRGHLFVDDHPYYAATAADGSFELPQVPPGRYQVICWMPNWNPLRQERDPESGLVTRLQFQPALERQQTIVIDPRSRAHVEFTVHASAFKR